MNAQPAETPPPPLDPGTLDNLVAWYDPTDAASVIRTGSNVDELQDKSSNANHLWYSSVNRPTWSATGGSNNLPYVQILGSASQELINGTVLAIPQPFTIYMMAKQTSFVDGKFLLGLDADNNNWIGYNSMSFGNMIGLNAGATYGRKVNGVNTKWQLLCSTFNGAYSRFSVNNEAFRRDGGVGSPPEGTAGTGNLIRIGFWPYYKMSDIQVQEIIILSEEPSESVDQSIRNYFTQKYVPVPNDFIVWFGDSITTGASATDVNRDGFFKLVNDHFGWDCVNYAVPGSVAVPTVLHPGITGENFADRYDWPLNVDISNFWMFYGHGTNDHSPDSAWKATYKSLLQQHIDAGANPAKMIMGGSYYHASGESTSASWIQDIASEMGLHYLDGYTHMAANGGSSLMNVDDLHPNDAGHIVYADMIIDLVESL